MSNVNSKSALRRAYGYGVHISLHSYDAMKIFKVIKKLHEVVITGVSVNVENSFAERPEATEANLLAYEVFKSLVTEQVTDEEVQEVEIQEEEEILNE